MLFTFRKYIFGSLDCLIFLFRSGSDILISYNKIKHYWFFNTYVLIFQQLKAIMSVDEMQVIEKITSAKKDIDNILVLLREIIKITDVSKVFNLYYKNQIFIAINLKDTKHAIKTFRKFPKFT